MRQIYLIRHGKPDFPDDERYCLGRSDMPLGTLGRLQACLLGFEPWVTDLTVFSSPLKRAFSTAKYLNPNPIVIKDLIEMDAGEWDGLSFREIKQRWPELYEQRGVLPELPIPGGEDLISGQRRFCDAVLSALGSSEGDIAVSAHSTVNQLLICLALKVPPTGGRAYKLRYGSYSVLEYDGAFHLHSLDQLPHPVLDRRACLALLDAAQCGDKICAHCKEVTAEALRITKALEISDVCLDIGLIETASLLHDIARTEPEHDKCGALWLDKLGYPSQAELIRMHHDLDSPELSEAAVLYIADKCVSETQHVSLDERFERSRSRCNTTEGKAAFERRYSLAMTIKEKINSVCKKEVIL